MVGNLFTTQLLVSHHGNNLYSVSLNYEDSGCDDPRSIVGTLSTRYANTDLASLIDQLLISARTLHIEFRDPTIRGDVNSPEPLPEGWQQVVSTHSRRLGWNPAYFTAAVPLD